MRFLGRVIIFFGLSNIYSSIDSLVKYGDSRHIIFVIVSLPIILLGWYIIRKENGLEQENAEFEAECMIRSANHGSLENFILYLRPFDTTNKYKITPEHLNFFGFDFWERDGFDDIERIVTTALNPVAITIALGKPGEHRGAARVLTTEEHWKIQASLLIKMARIIIILPGCKSGTLWEVEYIKNNRHFDKTIFIMPPSNSSYYQCDENDIQREWEGFKSFCNLLGMKIPPYNPDGLVFNLNDSGILNQSRKFPPPILSAWADALRELII